MNNKVKILILVLLTTLVSGCTANYDVKISLDGSVKENIELNENKNRIISDFTKKKFEDYVENYLELNELDNTINDYKLLIGDEKAGVRIDRKYDDINEYINTSPAIPFVFKKVKIRTKDEMIILKSVETGYELVYKDNQGVLNYTDSTITLSLPYEVISSNADHVDEETNTYTWNFDENFDGIEIKYNPNKKYTNDLFKLLKFATVGTYITIVVLAIAALLVLAILYFGIRLLIRERNI